MQVGNRVATTLPNMPNSPQNMKDQDQYIASHDEIHKLRYSEQTKTQ